jgi:hypothetical protein
MSAGELCAKIIYGELKGLKHEKFDLGVFTPTKLIWLGDIGLTKKENFLFN